MNEIELVAGQGIRITRRDDQVEINAHPTFDELDKLYFKVKYLNEMVIHLYDRVAELEMSEAKHDKFPALKEAFESYKMIERLCDDQDSQK